MTDLPFRYWRFCLWSGIIFLVTYFGFWGVMGSNVPPLPGNWSAQAISEHFSTNKNRMLFGMVCAMTFAPFYMIWGLGIAKVMRTLEGNNPVLSTMQLWGAGLTVIPVFMCCTFIMAGLYRVDSTYPEIVQIMYDVSWLTISPQYPVTSMQMIAVGICFLSDRRERPLLPKWVCWYSIWGGTMFLGENFMPFFKEGLFARNGILNFWVEYGIYFIYMPLMTYYLLKAVRRLELEYQSGLLMLPDSGFRYQQS